MRIHQREESYTHVAQFYISYVFLSHYFTMEMHTTIKDYLVERSVGIVVEECL